MIFHTYQNIQNTFGWNHWNLYDKLNNLLAIQCDQILYYQVSELNTVCETRFTTNFENETSRGVDVFSFQVLKIEGRDGTRT